MNRDQQVTYRCHGTKNTVPSEWSGEIRFIRRTEPYEIEATARGSCFHIIFGHWKNGGFLCVPNWKIGCEIVSPHDQFWNRESIQKSGHDICEADVVSISEAVAKASDVLDFML